MESLCCYSDYTIHMETAKITINQRQLIGMLSGGVNAGTGVNAYDAQKIKTD